MKGPKEVQMTLDIFPDRHQDELIQQIFKLIADDPKRTFKNILKGIIPERLLTYFLNEINITDQQKAGNISKETVRLFTELLKNFIFKVDRKSTRLNSSHVSISYAFF